MSVCHVLASAFDTHGIDDMIKPNKYKKGILSVQKSTGTINSFSTKW